MVPETHTQVPVPKPSLKNNRDVSRQVPTRDHRGHRWCYAPITHPSMKPGFAGEKGNCVEHGQGVISSPRPAKGHELVQVADTSPKRNYPPAVEKGNLAVSRVLPIESLALPANEEPSLASLGDSL